MFVCNLEYPQLVINSVSVCLSRFFSWNVEIWSNTVTEHKCFQQACHYKKKWMFAGSSYLSVNIAAILQKHTVFAATLQGHLNVFVCHEFAENVCNSIS